jgi:DUF4097 and DUF4098 domain-containing protein YvlB
LVPSRLILVLVTTTLAAAPPGLHKDGDFWVDTTSGFEAMGQVDQLRVVAGGNVTVHGGNGAGVSYAVTRKVRARNQSEARDRLQDAGVNFTRQGRNAMLIVDDVGGPVDLLVTVPRAVSRITVGTSSGNIDAIDIGGALGAETAAGNISVKGVKGDAMITTQGGNLDLTDIGGWVRGVTAAGDITAGLVGGDAQLETAGGNVTVQKIGGSARLVTEGGNIHLGQAGGAVSASTGGGTILVGSSGGARCESASGAIKVGSWNGMLRLSTASGSVVAQILGEKLLGDSYVSTNSGDITVYIPSNVGVTIRAQNEGGSRDQSIVSDFGTVQVRVSGGSAYATGAINGGGPLLRLEGTGGTIWIRKK